MINKELEGKLYFSDITINPFKGAIEVKDVVLIASGDTLVRCKTVLVDFKVRPLFNENIFVNRILLEKPVIKLLCRKSDSTWNFDHFAKPSTDTSKSNSKWVIDIKKLTFEKATVILIDSTSPYTPSGNVSYSNFNLNDFNLTLSTLLKLGESKYNVDISELKFIDKNSGFRLNNLAFKVEIDTFGVKIPSLIILTENSKVNLSAQMDSINFLGNVTDKNLFKAPLKLKLNAEPILADELLRLAPIPIKISGLIKLNSEFSGNLHNIEIGNLNLKFNNSDIAFNGNFNNLDDIKKMNYTVDFKKSKIERANLIELLPELHLSGLPAFGDLSINDLHTEGWVDSIFCKLNLASQFGNIIGWTGIGFKNNMSYSGSINTENINIAKILNNNELNSNISSRVDFSGSGTDLQDMLLKLTIASNNSKFQDFAFNKFKLSTNINKGIITFDTLSIENIRFQDSSSKDNSIENNSNIYSYGMLNLKNPKKPEYELKLKLEGINLAQLSKNENAPELLSGTVNLKGEGFQIDSLSGDVSAEIKECIFSDRALNPFQLTASIVKDENQNRTLNISSDFINIILTGNYNFSNLFNLIGRQGIYLSDLIKTKVNVINSEQNPIVKFKKPIEKISGFSPINLNLHAEVKDLSLLSAFLKDIKIHSVGSINISLDVNKTESMLRIDSIRINNFEYNSTNLDIASRPINISGLLDMYLLDSLPVLRNCTLDLKALSDIYINKLLLEKPSAELVFHEDTSRFKIAFGVNHIAGLYAKGNVIFKSKRYNLVLDTAKFTYHDSLSWSSKGPITASLNSEGVKINKFFINRANAETISLNGRINGNQFENLYLKTSNFSLKDINIFAGIEKGNSFIPLKGNADSLSVLINGTFDKPDLKISIDVNNMYYSGTYIGDIKGKLFHLDSTITGNLNIINTKNPNKFDVLSVDIKSLPLNLKLGDLKQRFHKASPVDIRIAAKRLPLELISPFAPAIDQLRGFADATLNISGFAPDKFEYNGNISITESDFRIQANNLYYTAKGKIDIETDKILLRNIELKNSVDDYSNGKAFITGTIELSQFDISNLDIYFNSPSIQMLGLASKKTMPALYGDFIVSTGPSPLHFFGSLQEPYLQGDINIMRAELQLPQNENNLVRKSSFIYQVKGNHIKLIPVDDTLNYNSNKEINIASSNGNHKNQNASFAELIDYDLNIKILGNFLVYMDLSSLFSIIAEIGLKDRSQPLRYVLKRGNTEPNLTGDIVVNEGSTLKFYKTFTTSGNIYFPTGSISNPGLDLTADYSGQSSTGNYKVRLLIKGTKNQPLVTFSYSINEIEAVGDSSKIKEDALMLVLFGKTKDEMKAGGGSGGLFNESNVASVASTYASAGFTNLLQSTGIIKSADIDFGKNLGSNSLDKATIIFTGQFFGGKWKAGGTVADLSTNNEISIEYPLSLLFNVPAFNNFVLQLSRSITTSAPTSRNQKDWEFKFKIGTSW
jgi:hypothetical protein